MTFSYGLFGWRRDGGGGEGSRVELTKNKVNFVLNLLYSTLLPILLPQSKWTIKDLHKIFTFNLKLSSLSKDIVILFSHTHIHTYIHT